MKCMILFISFFASAVTLACPAGGFCPGDRIIDSDDRTGNLHEVFSNGEARVTLDGSYGSFIRRTSTLGKGFQCIQKFCFGDRVLDSNDRTGTVLEVFSNGKARVTLDGSYGSFIRRISTLGKGFRCIEKVCVKDRMIDSSERTGTILELFDNGSARVTLDGSYGSFIRSFHNLGIELNCRLRENCSCRD